MARQNSVAPVATVPPMIAFIIAIAVLYFGRQILVPLALALLFAFLLSPVVKALQRLLIPRMPAVILVLLVAFTLIGGTAWVVTDQLIDIVNELPRYRNNIHNKIVAVQTPGSFSKLLMSLEDVGKELSSAPPAQPQAAPRKLARSARSAPSTVESSPSPQKVELVQPPPNALQSLRNFAGPLIEPLGTAGLVMIFTMFMLIDQEDLRNRLLGLSGLRRIHLTTKAMDDAARRVSRYLSMQFLVNTCYGIIIAFGLFFIGVPNVLLWAVIAMLLRFVPYVGPVIAGTLPFLLAVATTEGWQKPILVFTLFLIVEMITGNFVEPLVYGAHTGLSAVAILVAAVFWTALWGPVGLILSTPLTVCLSVLGRYSPHLQFLDILLGDEPALTESALLYQRLLALDQREALSIIEIYLRDKPLVDLYDKVIVPALVMAEQDRHGGQLESRHQDFILQSIHEFVTELSDSHPFPSGKQAARRVVPAGDPAQPARREQRVFSLAAHDSADEIAAAMLAQLAERNGFPALAFPYTDSAATLLEGLDPQIGDVICISSIPPLALTHARTLGQAVHDAFPEATLFTGLWCYPDPASRTMSQTANMATVSAAATGQASTLLSTVRQAGGAAGVALLGTVLGATGAGPQHPGGYRAAFVAAAALMAIGALIASRIRDTDAAATMAAGPVTTRVPPDEAPSAG